jgi:nicotinate phosphoribosyltransferase
MNDKNGYIKPMLTDFYQINMAYAYWLHGRHNEPAVFELFFRKNPFKGEFTIFAGLEQVLDFVKNFWFDNTDIQYLRSQMPACNEDFFKWLGELDCSNVAIYAFQEGSVCFPRLPLLRVEGPLAVCQLLETTLLNLVNFSCLIATNAARYRMAAGPDKTLLEFGLRRAQGPDGGLSASHFACMGGFDGTSNVLAGKLIGLPIKGTHAHSYVSSFNDQTDLAGSMVKNYFDFSEKVYKFRNELGYTEANKGELEAFIGYALAFPDGFLSLVDTYDTLKSGVPNFLAVAMALAEKGYKPIGVRLDSGDLAYLSKEIRKIFKKVSREKNVEFSDLTIVASNDINEETLWSLRQQGHEIDSFGIGTNLVTCQSQPALGGVYKLVEINGRPVVKLSQDKEKATIPGRKTVYRLVKDGEFIADIIMLADEEPPMPGQRILCRNPFEETKRAYAIPDSVKFLNENVWPQRQHEDKPNAFVRAKARVRYDLEMMREDHLRPLNPTPYKVAVSDKLYQSVHKLWVDETPIGLID